MTERTTQWRTEQLPSVNAGTGTCTDQGLAASADQNTAFAAKLCAVPETQSVF
jgi:hypothetical protein